MIFEQIYGKILEDAINLKLSDYNLKCRRYDEVAFKPLVKNPNEIALIVNGGGASRSSVVGQNQSSGTISIVLLFQKAYMDVVRSAIDSYQEESNAKLIAVKALDGTSVLFRPVFTTPIVLDAQDLPTANGTIKTALMQFTVTVIYGDTAGVEPDTYKIRINGALYTINNVLSYDNASIPSYDSYLAQGKDKSSQTAVARGNSFSLKILKTNDKEDAIQNILENELLAVGSYGELFGQELALQKNGNEVPIQAYQLTESYVDGTSVYVLTLML